MSCTHTINSMINSSVTSSIISRRSYRGSLRQRSQLQRSPSGIWLGWCWRSSRQTPKLCSRWTVRSEEMIGLDRPYRDTNRKLVLQKDDSETKDPANEWTWSFFVEQWERKKSTWNIIWVRSRSHLWHLNGSLEMVYPGLETKTGETWRYLWDKTLELLHWLRMEMVIVWQSAGAQSDWAWI